MNEMGQARWAQAIRAHIERHIGAIDGVVLADTAAAVAVHHIAPVPSRPYHTLITVGMSSAPMKVPAQVDAPQRVELMMTLPEHWNVHVDQEESRWPAKLLRSLSRFPHERETWLGWGHTVPNGDPPQPLSPHTDLCAVIVAPSLLVPVAFYELDVDGERVAFYSAIPLYKEELALKERDGMEALLSRLLQKDINDVVDPRRRNVAKRFLGWF